jgi:hypothetical protein
MIIGLGASDESEQDAQKIIAASSEKAVRSFIALRFRDLDIANILENFAIYKTYLHSVLQSEIK